MFLWLFLDIATGWCFKFKGPVVLQFVNKKCEAGKSLGNCYVCIRLVTTRDCKLQIRSNDDVSYIALSSSCSHYTQMLKMSASLNQ